MDYRPPSREARNVHRRTLQFRAGEGSGVRVLCETPHFRLTVDRQRALVHWARSSVPIATLAQYEDMARKTVLALLALDRSKHSILIDVRQSPLRNDPSFDEAMLRFRRDIHRGFARTAVLVRTRAGVLQISRHAKERPDDVPEFRTFMDEAEAIAFLTGT
jgi:hypothetical protein